MKVTENGTGHRKGVIRLLLTIIVGLMVYSHYRKLGFPDGHLTEYERYLKLTLYPVFFMANALFALAFLWTGFRKKNKRWLWWFYLLFLLLFLAMQYYLSTVLENGQGG